MTDKQYIILFFKILLKFLDRFLNYCYDISLSYYVMFIRDFLKLEKAIIWTSNFFVNRFTKKGFLGKIIAFFTFLSIFTVYPLMIFLIFSENILDVLIRYSFVPIDILFKNYLLKVNWSSKGNDLTIKSIYKGICRVKTNLNRIKSINSFLLRYLDKIFWANKLIRTWNRIDDFLYHVAIGIEYYIYFVIAGFKTTISFASLMKRYIRFYVFNKVGREGLKVRIRFYFRRIRYYLIRLFHFFKFILRWYSFRLKCLIHKFFFRTWSNLKRVFWFIIWIIWEVFVCFTMGIIMILRIPLLCFRIILRRRSVKKINNLKLSTNRSNEDSALRQRKKI